MTKNGVKEFWRKFRMHRLAAVAAYLLLAMTLVIIFLPVVAALDPITIDAKSFSKPPSPKHILGTDEIGRDIFARLIYGGRISLFVGITSTLISVAIGLPLGLVAGYYQGALGTIVMRTVDLFMSFPVMVLILVLVAIFGPSLPTVIFVIGLLGWTHPAKLIYGNVISVRKREYVEAARAIGTNDFVILTKYVLPNSIAPLWMSVAFRISHAIIMESSLSFLGAGIQPPQASWGNILYDAQSLKVLTGMPWVWVPAGVCLLFTVVCINLIGEGVRDALDPKMKR